MRMRTLWTIFGVAVGSVACQCAGSVLFAASVPVAVFVPTRLARWILPAEFTLSILLSLACWAAFIWLSTRWGKASEARMQVNPDRSTTPERVLLWFGVVVSTGYLAAVGLLTLAFYLSGRGSLH